MYIENDDPLDPAVEDLLRFFDYEEEPDGPIHTLVEHIALLADQMVHTLPQNPELAAGMRKLLEARDCFVRSALDIVAVA